MIIESLEYCNKKYSLIYSDPPWAQTKGNVRKCRPNQGKQLDYSTLSLEEIKDIHKYVLNNLTYQKHNVFMWSIDKYLHEAEQMMSDLGYTLHARMIWDKTNGVAPAFTVRYSHEYLLWFYRKGNILMSCEEQRGKYTTVIREPATTHSKKPLAAYEMLEAMFPYTHKIEMFARNTRDGWDCWGNEVAFFDEREKNEDEEIKKQAYTENFWAEDIKNTFERIKILMKYNCLPYIMRYEKYNISPYYGTYVNLASWCNQPNMFKKKSYRQWCIDDDKRKGGNSATIRYLKQFENDYPQIAKEYFDLKFEDINKY